MDCLLSRTKRLPPFIFDCLFQLIIQRVPFEHSAERGVLGPVHSVACRRYHRDQTLRYVRYHIKTGARNFGMFGTLSIPVPDTSVSSLRHQYWYGTLSKFSMTSLPVPDTSVKFGMTWILYRRYMYRLSYGSHTLR